MTAMYDEVFLELYKCQAIDSDFGCDLVVKHNTNYLQLENEKNGPVKCRKCKVYKSQEVKLQRCSRCKSKRIPKRLSSYYCSKKCQEDHWKYHYQEHRWYENSQTKTVLNYKKEFAEHFQDTLKAIQEEDFEDTRRMKRFLFEESQRREENDIPLESMINYKQVLVVNRKQQTGHEVVIDEKVQQIPRSTVDQQNEDFLNVTFISVGVDTSDIPPEGMPRALKYPYDQMLAITWIDGKSDKKRPNNKLKKQPSKAKPRYHKKIQEEDPESKWNLAIGLLSLVVDHRVGGKGTAIRRSSNGNLIRKTDHVATIKSGIHERSIFMQIPSIELPNFDQFFNQ
uniref:MYND-type domain-containing protein n=1 Tax=Ciona savignyi TaxID=51511 RepID=H2Y6Y4_CIOSA